MSIPPTESKYAAKIVEAARELLKSYGYFIDVLWHVDDVHLLCEQQNLPKITDAEAMEVFAIAARDFDGETGISWPQLEHALRMYLQDMLVFPCENDPV